MRGSLRAQRATWGGCDARVVREVSRAARAQQAIAGRGRNDPPPCKKRRHEPVIASQPGVIHEAYSRFWNYSLGNQILALMQCRARVIEPGPLASFNRWKELGRHVRKGQRALELCMPLKLKAKEWDEKRAKDNPAPTADGEEPGCRTIFVFKKNWFVLSQTEGAPYEPEPIPAWDRAAALTALNIREEAFALVDGNTQGYAT